MPFGRINRTYKNLQRLQQIVNVLLKHGFSQVVEQLHLTGVVSFGKRVITFSRASIEEPTEHLTFGERARLALSELGPTFVKFGQIMSTRPDLLPLDFIEELKKLQDQVTPIPFDLVVRQVEEALGVPWKEVFANIEKECIAAASIAQVHGAELLSGEEVVVKVQRPAIAAMVNADIGILFNLAHLAEHYIPESRRYSPVALVEEFAKTIRREMDFIQEASNTERFRKLFENYDGIYIPRVYWDMTTGSLLTLERIRGISIDDFDELDRRHIDRKYLARLGGEIFITEVLEFGIFHADPHPGNIFILEDGCYGLVDFGLIGRIERDLKESLATIVYALVSRDYDRMLREFIHINLVPDDIDRRRFKRDLMDLIEPYFGQPIKHLAVGPIIQQVLDLITRYQARILPDLLMLARALVIMEGIGRQLDPELDLVAIGVPFAGKLFRDRFSPQRIAADTYRAGSELRDMLRALPDQVNLLMRKALRDEFTYKINLLGLDLFRDQLDRVGNRLALSLTICALVIGSSVVLLAGQPPYYLGYPIIGLVGFSIAGFLGVWLMFSILRSGKF